MIIEQETICSCGVRFCEEFDCYMYDDLIPISIKPRRCTNCGGIITDEQRKELSERIYRKMKLLEK